VKDGEGEMDKVPYRHFFFSKFPLPVLFLTENKKLSYRKETVCNDRYVAFFRGIR